MIIYQDLAYCRLLFIWSFLYLFDLVHFSPLITLIIVVLIDITNNKSYMNPNKRYGIVLSEIYLIIAICTKSRKLYVLENMIVFILYCGFLLVMGTNIKKLHTKQLVIDDKLHSEETYWNYLGRVWYSFFMN